VAGSAYAAFQCSGAGAAGKKEGYPVAVFYPGIYGFSNGVVYSKYVEQLGPEPFGGVDTADELQIIDIEPGGVGVDGGCLFYGAVVLPEDEEGVGVVFEGGEKAEGGACFVDGDRG